MRDAQDCSKTEKEGNHWFVVRSLPEVQGVLVTPVIDIRKKERREGDKDACGEACALKLVSKMMRKL